MQIAKVFDFGLSKTNILAESKIIIIAMNNIAFSKPKNIYAGIIKPNKNVKSKKPFKLRSKII